MRIERDTLIKLRDAVIQNDNGMNALREAGYAGGNSLFDSFAGWAREKNDVDVTQLPLQEFSKHCAEFWRQAGWGELTVREGENDTAVAEVANCWEVSSDGDGCHITTGLLSAFFGKLSDYPLAVLETQCSPEKCRFAMGSVEAIQGLHNSSAP